MAEDQSDMAQPPNTAPNETSTDGVNDPTDIQATVAQAGPETSSPEAPKDIAPVEPQPVIETSNDTETTASTQLVESLRAQITDLYTQVSQLNSKLVQSYDSRASLEDELHVKEQSLLSSTTRISSLEAERTEHLAALNTGLLVEKSQVTAELTRLMERATEEAKQRGQAEDAKADIEKDLDDLSATLFSQANTMVAEARYARAMSERKVTDSEVALKGAEEAVSVMQLQMQRMQAELDTAQSNVREMSSRMDKGKWVKNDANLVPATIWKYRNSHAPYAEFINFLAHLRSLRPSSQSPPQISTLVSQPFLARLSNEDFEPTIRLDIAPALNWLSRRSVLSAIHAGQLNIEPMSTPLLLLEPPFSTSSNHEVCCALCGVVIIPGVPKAVPSRPVSRNATRTPSSGSGSWFKSTIQSIANAPAAVTTPPSSPPAIIAPRPVLAQQLPQVVYIFRLSPLGTGTSTSVSSVVNSAFPGQASTSNTSVFNTSPVKPNGTSTPKSAPTTVYPLCQNWCLPRLRSACSLWAFVRGTIVDKIWEDSLPLSPVLTAQVPSISIRANGTSSPPPIPPRKRGLWGMATALGERAASWAEDKSREKGALSPPPEKELPKSPHSAGIPPPLPPRNTVRVTSENSTPIAAPIPIVEIPPTPALDDPSTHSENVSSLDDAQLQSTSKHIRNISSGSVLFDESAAHSEEAASNEIEQVGETPVEDPKTPPEPVKDPLPEAQEEAVEAAPVVLSVEPEVKKEDDLVPLSAKDDKSAEATPIGTPNGTSANLPPVPRRAPRRVAPKPGDAPKRDSVDLKPSSDAVKDESQVHEPIADSSPTTKDPVEPVPSAVSESIVQTDPSTQEAPKSSESEQSPEAVEETPEILPAISDASGTAETPSAVEGVTSAPSSQPNTVEELSESTLEPEVGALPEVQTTPLNVEQPVPINGNYEAPLSATPDAASANASTEVLMSNGTSNSDKAIEEITEEGFVGNSSWEDKTWREVLKLKEEMFLMRVGALKIEPKDTI